MHWESCISYIIAVARLSFWTLLAIQVAALLLGASLARADRYEVDVPSRAYLFGMTDWKADTDACQSVSGTDIVCQTQRTQVIDPFYVGVGVDLLKREKWRFGVEADYDPGLSGEYSVVPQLESTRGLSLKGSFSFHLL